MQIKQSLLRVAAATTVTVAMTVGFVGPVEATGGDDRSGHSSSRSDGHRDGGHDKSRHDKGDHEDGYDKGHDGSKSDGGYEKDDYKGKGHQDGGDKGDKGGYDHSEGNASTQGEFDEPQPESKADKNDGGANAGDCEDGPKHSYCSTRDGSASQNGKGDGEAKGKPCAGCVGKADNKNPKGQYPNGSDRNAGYECDRNQGVGKGNPAHTGCTGTSEDVEYDEAEYGHEKDCKGKHDHAKPQPKPAVVEPEPKPEPEPEPKPVVVTPETPEKPLPVACPDDAKMVDGTCVVPVPVEDEQTCPTGTTMNEEGDACLLPVEPVDTTPEVLGVEQEAEAPAFVEAERPVANRAPAAVAPVAGILPATGAGAYGTAVLAALGLLAAGGVLIARRRPQAED